MSFRNSWRATHHDIITLYCRSALLCSSTRCGHCKPAVTLTVWRERFRGLQPQHCDVLLMPGGKSLIRQLCKITSFPMRLLLCLCWECFKIMLTPFYHCASLLQTIHVQTTFFPLAPCTCEFTTVDSSEGINARQDFKGAFYF